MQKDQLTLYLEERWGEEIETLTLPSDLHGIYPPPTMLLVTSFARVALFSLRTSPNDFRGEERVYVQVHPGINISSALGPNWQASENGLWFAKVVESVDRYAHRLLDKAFQVAGAGKKIMVIPGTCPQWWRIPIPDPTPELKLAYIRWEFMELGARRLNGLAESERSFVQHDQQLPRDEVERRLGLAERYLLYAQEARKLIRQHIEALDVLTQWDELFPSVVASTEHVAV